MAKVSTKSKEENFTLQFKSITKYTENSITDKKEGVMTVWKN